eukprot:6197260-Pleurochrysis_carterae.AAC.1
MIPAIDRTCQKGGWEWGRATRHQCNRPIPGLVHMHNKCCSRRHHIAAQKQAVVQVPKEYRYFDASIP